MPFLYSHGISAGALSIMYLPASIPVRTMLVAHNSDYNGTWHLGTPVRSI